LPNTNICLFSLNDYVNLSILLDNKSTTSLFLGLRDYDPRSVITKLVIFQLFQSSLKDGVNLSILLNNRSTTISHLESRDYNSRLAITRLELTSFSLLN
jgi:hypothetical protein